MADRVFKETVGSLHYRVVRFFGAFTVDAAGAITSTNGVNTKSMFLERLGVGDYLLGVTGNFQKFLGLIVTKDNQPSATKGGTVYTDDPGFNSDNGRYEIGVGFGRQDGAGAWVSLDPPAGTILFEAVFDNSSL